MKKQKAKKQVRPVQEILPDSPDVPKAVPRIKTLATGDRVSNLAVDKLMDESIERTHYGTIEEQE